MGHTKSPCCRARIRRYGKRRRQCTACCRTWRVYQRKRGRKPQRIKTPLIGSLFEIHATVRQLALCHPRLQPSKVVYRFRRQLRLVSEQHSHCPLPPGPLALLADGFWCHYLDGDWVIYLCAVKPFSDNRAWVLEPLVIKGKERYRAWKRVIDSLPLSVRNRVKAFVSDGFRGSARIASQHGWIHQLCHFHLLAQLYNRAGRRKRTLVQRARRKRIIRLIRCCLVASKTRCLSGFVYRLRREIYSPYCPLRFRQIGREFLRHVDSFRAYHKYPHWHLPTTTGSLESYGKELRRYTRCLSTIKALSVWLKAFVKYNPSVLCNGKIINQI